MYFLMSNKGKNARNHKFTTQKIGFIMPDMGCMTHETVSGRGFQTAPSPLPLPSQRLDSNIFLFNKYYGKTNL